jgi:xanthine/uracil/vitamin C permease (AzgA family)
MLAEFDINSLTPALKAVADSGLSVTIGGASSTAKTDSLLPSTTDTFPTGLAIGLGAVVLGALFLFSKGRKVQ